MLNLVATGYGLSLPAAVVSRRSMDEKLAERLRVKEAAESFCLFAKALAERIEARRIDALEDPERWDGME